MQTQKLYNFSVSQFKYSGKAKVADEFRQIVDQYQKASLAGEGRSQNNKNKFQELKISPNRELFTQQHVNITKNYQITHWIDRC